MNTALAVHLMLRVMHLTAGHVRRPVYWVGCFSRGSAAAVEQARAAGCVVIRFAPHSVRMWW